MDICWYYIYCFFTATITSDLTTQKLQNNISSVRDLVGKRVTSIKNSTASRYLSDINIQHSTVDSAEDAYKKLNNDETDAVIYDSPALEYYESHDGKGKAKTVGESFKPENYGIAIANNSPLRVKLDKALLSLEEDGTYGDLYKKWFGK